MKDFEDMRVCVIPGDGIGREVIPAAIEVLQATSLPLEFVHAEAGWECFERHGTALPDETLAAARAADAVLFGAVGSPSFAVPGYRSPIVALRRALDLYANIRPAQNQGPRTKNQEIIDAGSWFSVLGSRAVDLVVVRENTEGLYAGRERLEDGGETAIAERVITRRASERIVRAAFDLARSRHLSVVSSSLSVGLGEQPLTANNGRRTRPRVTIVHKANVMRETCGLFRATALRVAEEYPDVAHEEMLVDNCALQLVQRPERFDVIVTTNMFGDILSDVASYWGGGLGLAVSANIGAGGRALFEPVHGSAPDIAGKGIANPLAAIGCAALLLEHLANCKLQIAHSHSHDAAQPRSEQAIVEQFKISARRIHTAIAQVRIAGPHTPDMDGVARTQDIAAAVINAMSGA
jgi:homoisocitrate dehydrogenase